MHSFDASLEHKGQTELARPNAGGNVLEHGAGPRFQGRSYAHDPTAGLQQQENCNVPAGINLLAPGASPLMQDQ